MKDSIYIANGQGFWGDSVDAPVNLVKSGYIDYLTLDYLAEVTLSIMQRQKLKNPDFGYASDFVQLISRCSKQLIENNIKIITNAGGANPWSLFNVSSNANDFGLSRANISEGTKGFYQFSNPAL